MKTFTRTLLLAALTAASGLSAACSDKNEAPAPADPAPAFQMSSYFDFAIPTPTGGTAHSGYGTGYRPADITGMATLGPQVLTLNFVAGFDNTYFEVERTKLSAKWLGAYPLRCRNRPTDPVFTSYLRGSTNNGTSIYRLSDFTRDLTGNVTITAYDAKRQLVSGTYEVRAPEQNEPSATITIGGPKCTIILEGSFENLKVKGQ